MRAPLLYSLLQLPGIMFLGVILVVALEKGWVTGFTALVIFLAWIVKDVLLYPLYRNALSPGSQNVIARLYGSTALVIKPLNPEGQVALRGEIWRAVSLDGRHVESGARVVVEGNKGLTLEVSRK